VCTLSWTRSAHGYVLLFNRDERLSRPNADPPTRQTVAGVRILAPVDPAAGGTWIGVNHHGVTATLLNRYDDAPVDPAAGSVSRGILLRSLLAARSARAAVAAATEMSLGAFQPFTVAAFDRGARAWLADWNGRTLAPSTIEDTGLVRTSSGRDQAEAERSRSAVLAAMTNGTRLSPALLRAFHQSHQPERGPFSVCMHRDEAATRSLTMVRLARRHATMWYWHGAPCTNPVVTRRRLRLAVGR
jgi:hypothetical protein